MARGFRFPSDVLERVPVAEALKRAWFLRFVCEVYTARVLAPRLMLPPRCRPLIRDVGTYTAALILLRVFFSDGAIPGPLLVFENT